MEYNGVHNHGEFIKLTVRKAELSSSCNIQNTVLNNTFYFYNNILAQRHVLDKGSTVQFIIRVLHNMSSQQTSSAPKYNHYNQHLL